MNNSELYEKLKASYTHDNLQKITRKIIALYKSKQYNAIDTVMQAVAGQMQEKTGNQGKSFYKLMMVYHPDRLNYYLGEIEKYHNAKDTEQLLRFSHIFTALELEQSLVILKSSPPQSDPYRDIWENEVTNFGEYDEMEFKEEEEEEYLDEFEEMTPRNTFFTVFKRQMYGNTKIELPFYYLEDIDVIDLAGCGIDDLDGIRYCKQLAMLDLSNNRIPDVSELITLVYLQEVYLANNRIGYIDGLSFLHNLRVVDLSNNNIDDLSPLFELEHLEYVNVMGNKIPAKQLNTLRKKGVMVIY